MEKINLIKILYNDCYGGFRFSQEFVDKYIETYGDANDISSNGGKYISHAYIKIRYYPKVIKVFEMMDAKEAGKKPTSKITIAYIPEEYREYATIDEYDGSEGIVMNFNQAYRDLIFKIFEKHSCEITDELEQEFRRLKYVEEKYGNMEDDNIDPEIFNIVEAKLEEIPDMTHVIPQVSVL